MKLSETNDDNKDYLITATQQQTPVPPNNNEPKRLSKRQPQAASHCRFCSQSFPSRNALFRHLSSESQCSALVVANGNLMGSTKGPTMQRYEMAILFGYHHDDGRCIPINDDTIVSSEAQRAGHLLIQSFESAMCECSIGPNNSSLSVQILSYTQSSMARMRHRVLSQEVGCAGVGDVMVVSWRQQHQILCREQHEKATFMKSFMDQLQRCLDKPSPPSQGLQVQIQACKWLDDKYHLHAERACTQRVYHYLLPVSWLPGGDTIRDWWLNKIDSTNNNDASRFTRPHSSQRIHEERHGRDSRMPSPPKSLQHFKQLLRQVESEELLDDYGYNDDDDDKFGGETTTVDSVDRSSSIISSRKRAAGRFGTMARRERRPWHNYADPALRGDASPNNEPVWRVMDRARVVQFLIDKSDDTNNDQHSNNKKVDDDVVAVLEFRGDEFLPQQIRRIVGTVVAMSHGWLPVEMLETSTCASQFVETVLAPKGRLYLASVRFHFDEMRTGGRPLFESDNIGPTVTRNYTTHDNDDGGALDWIQNRLLQLVKVHKSEELQWMNDLRLVVSPRIRHQLSQLQTFNLQKNRVVHPTLSLPPTEYALTLQLLRNIVKSNAWPSTTAARSSVIVSSCRDDNNKNNYNGAESTGGSFTVMNPHFLSNDNNQPLPLGNALFPELTKAIFDLEACLSAQQQRKEPLTGTRMNNRHSSHCAVNCNSQFAPHVDSGRGAGQSLSMIVGLGDYQGGELAVEGNYHDIQYKPLEFDGWKMRHWTLPFVGERFSLVWFTPHTESRTRS